MAMWVAAGALAAATMVPARAQAPAQTQGLQPIPALTARVTDLTGTLTATQQAELEQRLAAFEGRKGTQIAVLLVPTTAPEQIEQYSIRVVDAWKLGRKNVDDGALLLIAKNDHTLRIENGYGLEGVLTDAASNRIIQDTMVPLLRQGQYFAAISAGVDQMMHLVDGEPLPPPDQSWQRRAGAPHAWNFVLPLIIAFFVIASVLHALLGRTIGAVLTGAATGLLAFVFSQALMFAIGAAVVAFLAARLLGFSSGGWSSGGRGGRGGPGGPGGPGGSGGQGPVRGRLGGAFGGLGGLGWLGLLGGFGGFRGIGGGLGGGLGGGGFGGGGFGGGGFGGGGFGGGGGGFGGGGASGSW
ncbi:MAG: TPM domain-containing protein [Steroidobacteraceae bacterium]